MAKEVNESGPKCWEQGTSQARKFTTGKFVLTSSTSSHKPPFHQRALPNLSAAVRPCYPGHVVCVVSIMEV
jgi:hypothetical protein